MTRKEEYHEYLKSPEWKAFRKRVFEHYGKKCAECKRTKHLHIHHKTYENVFNEKLEDVIVLCEIHHAKIHGINIVKPKEKKKKKRSHIPKDVKYYFNKPNKKHKKRDLKKVKGNHAIKTEHPILDAILSNKIMREQSRLKINSTKALRD
jgi:hypothetical protein